MSKRILIIDDEEHIRRMMRLTLEAAGYEVGEAPDGSEGVKAFGDGSSWSLVVLDQRMPGMDGLETLRELKNRNNSARVVMATAYASIELAVDAMKLGATDFVRKPMTPEVLRNSVAAALSKSPVETPVSGAQSAPSSIPQPSIQTITMNGFTILDDTETLVTDDHQRRFVVVSPDGERHDVLVEIQNEPIEYVQRLTGHYLAPDNSFWTSQARDLLSDFLWNEGKTPPMHRLVMKSLGPEKLPVAARWKA
ncbi:MAG TPA: response regulator [Pyrinomonadaceae bacterium]|jgi:DNA-binding response OmpR family regulator|nr:response regulator [Pyrinomonadaceae bacterium]